MFVIALLAAVGITLQSAIIPALLPRVLQPDVFLLMGIGVLAYGAKEFGLAALFVLGIAADLLGSGRLGISPLAYLCAAGIITRFWHRELTRGDLAAAWIGALAATLMAQLVSIPLNALFLPKLDGVNAAGKAASLMIAACIWGIPVVYLTGQLMFKRRAMSPQVQARWSNNERTSDAQRKVAG